MAELLLIRHGRTYWNEETRFQGQLNSDLNDVGTAQAKALGERFQSEALDCVYSSDLGRAWSTAQALIGHHKNEPVEHRALRERAMGVFEGCTQPEIETDNPEAWKKFLLREPDYKIPDGESIEDVLERSNLFLEHVAQHHKGEKIAAITHGGWIRVVLKGLLGLEQRMPTRFKVLNTSIHRLKFLDGHWWVMGMGDVSHLEESLQRTSSSHAL